MMRIADTVFYLSCVYLATLVVASIASLFLPTFDQVGHLNQGCYWTDALVIFVKCQGFGGSEIAAWLFNLPLNLFYVPMFGVVGVLEAPWLLPYAALIWAPIIYFCWHLVRALTRRSRGTAQKRAAP